MKKFLKFWAVGAILILGVTLLAIDSFYAYDQFTADSSNDGAAQRGALKKYANANVPFVVDSNPANMGSRTTTEVITSAFTTWNDVPTSIINATISSTRDFTISDVVGATPPILVNNLNEVLNVDTEAMADSLGISRGVLGIGIASRFFVNTGAIVEGTLIMVTAFGEGGSDFESTATHELGHVVGLMHTPITPFSTLADETLVPTMYPFSLSSDRLGRTLEPDDIASISAAYPHSSFQSTLGTIRGTITDSNGLTVFGAHVFAFNVQTGDIVGRFSGHSSRANGTGEYIMQGVPPGQYVVGVQRLQTDNLGSSQRLEPNRFDSFYTRADNTFLDTFHSTNPAQPPATVVNVTAGQTATVNMVVRRTLSGQDDAFEENNGPASARSIDPGAYNLNLLSGDEDWFKIRLGAGADLRILAQFNDEIGDLDISLFDPNGTVIASGQSETDDELVGALNVVLPGDYLIRVVGFNNAANSYTLTVFADISTAVEAPEPAATLPKELTLSQNYPNPFNPETTIRYALPSAGHVEVAVFDLRGQQVALLESGFQQAGPHTIRWDGRNRQGNSVSSGLYFYRLQATSRNGAVTTLIKKMTLMQ